MWCELPIQFISAERIVSYGRENQSERCGKLLDPSSSLYQMAEQHRKRIMRIYPNQVDDSQRRMPFHLEVVNADANAQDTFPGYQLLLKCAAQLQGKPIRCGWNDLVVCAEAIVLKSPSAEGCDTCLVIAKFTQGGVPYSFPWLQNNPEFDIIAHHLGCMVINYHGQTYYFQMDLECTKDDLLEMLRESEEARKDEGEQKTTQVGITGLDNIVEDIVIRTMRTVSNNPAIDEISNRITSMILAKSLPDLMKPIATEIVKETLANFLDGLSVNMAEQISTRFMPDILEHLRSGGLVKLTPKAIDSLLKSARKRKDPSE